MDMRKALVENGVVINVLEVDAGSPDWAQALPDAGPAGPGWLVDGETFVPSVEREPQAVIPDLTFAQLLIGLVAEGWITETEGDAWLSGTPPAAALALVAQLPANQRFAARARLVRPTMVERGDALVNGLAALQSKTTEDMDAFFTAYAAV